MTGNAREKLRLLVAAFEEHLEAVASRKSPADAAVDDAYEALAEAFEAYEEAIDVEFAESLPVVLDDSDDFDDDTDDDDDDDDDDPLLDSLDPHAEEDEDDMDDDIEVFDLKS